MREIKFRGKRIDNGEWVYGDLLKPFKSQFYVLDYSKFDYDCFEHIGEVAEEFEVVPETVGQFTGLLDKNGKEIYEGDIIKSIHEFNNSVYIGEVYFEDFTWFGAKDYLSYIEEWCIIEIIGNIHDNQELIND